MDPLHDEETQLMTTLSSLEGSTSRHIAELFGSSLEDRAAFNARSSRIREDLAALRAAMRDLATLAEEQDTCVLIDVAMLPTSHVQCTRWREAAQALYCPTCWYCAIYAWGACLEAAITTCGLVQGGSVCTACRHAEGPPGRV